MSHSDAIDPICTEQSDSIAMLIQPKSKDLGGFSVKRVLPASRARSIGPFVFFDEMGPSVFPAGEGINVRPHPHIGLSTVTFLFDGEILHRDSLGYVQPIKPGAVNLMTAGSGIVHSERTSEEKLANGQRLHGIQVWMALPKDQQEIEPAFAHYPKSVLPIVKSEGVETTVIIGSYAGQTSPVEVLPETLYLGQTLGTGHSVTIDADIEERAIYVVDGSIRIEQMDIPAGAMIVLQENAKVKVLATQNSQLMIIGGESLARRHLWWNFVHTSEQRIEQAKQDWTNKRFEEVPGDEEFIPLPK